MYNQRELEEIHSEIKTKLASYCQHANNHEAQEITKIFTDDSVMISELGLIQGKLALTNFYVEFLKNLGDFKVDIFSEKIFESNGRIYEIGTNAIETHQGDTTTVRKGNYCSIWVKKSNGWYIQEDLIPPTPK